MTEILNISNDYSAQSLNNPANQKTDMARDDFLKLLLAQMTNQDPLEPMDNQEFAAQLAQFSSLEQLQSINGNIEYGVEMDYVLTSSINNTLAATIIGKEATAFSDTIAYNDSGEAQFSFKVESDAAAVEITITNESGTVVRTITENGMASGEHTMTWDGKNDDGEDLPDSTYHFSVKATNGEGDEISSESLVKGLITGVRYENGGAVLMINGVESSFASILEIGLEDNG